MTRFSTSLLALGLLLGVSACGGDSASGSTAPADIDVDVRALDGVVWNAGSYSATATDGVVTIYGANNSSLPHNLYVLDGDGKQIGDFIDLPTRGSDGTIDVELTPGEYRIVCQIPGHSAMNSALVVD